MVDRFPDRAQTGAVIMGKVFQEFFAAEDKILGVFVGGVKVDEDIGKSGFDPAGLKGETVAFAQGLDLDLIGGYHWFG